MTETWQTPALADRLVRVAMADTLVAAALERGVTLEVKGRPARGELAWLTPTEAREVAGALFQAAAIAERSAFNDRADREPAVPRPPFCPRCGLGMLPPYVGTTLAVEEGPDVCNRCEEIEAYLEHEGDGCQPPDEWPLDPDVIGEETATLSRVMRDHHGWARWAATGHPNLPPEWESARAAFPHLQDPDRP